MGARAAVIAHACSAANGTPRTSLLAKLGHKHAVFARHGCWTGSGGACCSWVRRYSRLPVQSQAPTASNASPRARTPPTAHAFARVDTPEHQPPPMRAFPQAAVAPTTRAETLAGRGALRPPLPASPQRARRAAHAARRRVCVAAVGEEPDVAVFRFTLARAPMPNPSSAHHAAARNARLTRSTAAVTPGHPGVRRLADSTGACPWLHSVDTHSCSASSRGCFLPCR